MTKTLVMTALAVSSIAYAAGTSKQPEKAGAANEVKTASGLIYTELKAGSGPSPAATDTVKVNYKGTLPDGTEFDSSYKRGQPAEFPLMGVIPCWTEGVQKMKVGEKARLVCPSNIAYGDQGRPPTIPGGSTLVFEIELMAISTKPPAATPQLSLPPPSGAHPVPPPSGTKATPPTKK